MWLEVIISTYNLGRYADMYPLCIARACWEIVQGERGMVPWHCVTVFTLGGDDQILPLPWTMSTSHGLCLGIVRRVDKSQPLNRELGIVQSRVGNCSIASWELFNRELGMVNNRLTLIIPKWNESISPPLYTIAESVNSYKGGEIDSFHFGMINVNLLLTIADSR